MPAESPAPTPPPLGVENYQLGAEISTGGMGSVLEAHDAKLDRTVAIKVMLLEANADARMRARFLREAQVLAKLAHPNIVPIYDIVWEDGQPLFYSMKRIKGRTLHAILTDLRKQMPETLRDYSLDRLLTIFRKVCDAIAFAHSQGVLHRDLKPENIMVGEFGEVLVMDWGLAKLLRSNDEFRIPNDEDETHSLFAIRNSSFTAPHDSFAHTLVGAVLGTPQYMSPEQACGDMTDVDELSDIYALGGILYAILTLRPPVEGATAQEVLEKVSKGEITSPTALKNSSGSRGKVFEKGEVLEAKQIKPLPHLRGGLVPSALSSVAMKALRLAKERRYPRVTELSADIEAYQNGFATKAEDAGLMTQIALLVRRHRHAFTTAAAALLLITALAAAFVVNLRVKEQRALAGESLAVEQKEAARRAEAQAIIGLADAAMSDGNSPRMQDLLDSVPEDLRDSNWHYLLDQSDTSVAHLEFDQLDVSDVAPLPRRTSCFAVGLFDGRVLFVNGRTGARLAEIASGISPSPGRRVSILAVSPAEDVIAIGQREDEGGIVIRRVRDGQEILRWDAPRSVRLDFSADGSLLLQRSLSPTGYPFTSVWDMASGALLWQDKQGLIATWASTAEGEVVIVGGSGATLRMRNARDGSLIRDLGRTGSDPAGLAFHRHGLLAVLTGRREVIVLNLADDSVLTRFATGSSTSRDHFIGWTPDGTSLATVWKDQDGRQSVQLRNPRNGTVLRTLLGGKLGIRNLAIHPVSGELAIGLGGVYVWDTLPTPPVHAYPPTAGPGIGFIGSDDALFTNAIQGKGACVQLLSPQGPRLLWTNQHNNHNHLSVSRDGMTAAVSCAAPRWPVLILQRRGDEMLQTSAVKTQQPSYRIRLSPMGDELAIFGGKLERFTITGSALPALQHDKLAQSHDLAWLPKAGRMIGLVTVNAARLSTRAQEHICLWDTASGKLIQEVRHATPMDFIAVTPDERRFAEAGTDKMVRLRDANTLAVVREFRAHNGPLTAMTCHPLHPILATASTDLTVRLWNLETGALLEELRGPITPPTQLMFSPSGHRLACAARDDESRIWAPKTLQTKEAK
ncbi:MAG: protein kinase [Verrucomicrobiaceae bacterium]|nr:protein kinase [Verrucomicrobiaceae bacterium]